MAFDRNLSHFQLSRYRLVRLSHRHHAKHLFLPLSQNLGALRRAHLAHQQGGGLRGQLDLARGRAFDRLRQRVAVRIFQEVSDSAGADSREHPVVVQHTGQRDHFGIGERLPDGDRRCDAVHLGQEQVHQHHVRLKFEGKADRLFAVLRLPNHLEFRVYVQVHLQAVPDDRMVVHDQYPNWHPLSCGGLSSSKGGPSNPPSRRGVWTPGTVQRKPGRHA